jgi:hypothetical protein
VVGIVLGVSMAPTNVRMVLVEGESADGGFGHGFGHGFGGFGHR